MGVQPSRNHLKGWYLWILVQPKEAQDIPTEFPEGSCLASGDVNFRKMRTLLFVHWRLYIVTQFHLGEQLLSALFLSLCEASA